MGSLANSSFGTPPVDPSNLPPRFQSSTTDSLNSWMTRFSCKRRNDGWGSVSVVKGRRVANAGCPASTGCFDDTK